MLLFEHLTSELSGVTHDGEALRDGNTIDLEQGDLAVRQT